MAEFPGSAFRHVGPILKTDLYVGSLLVFLAGAAIDATLPCRSTARSASSPVFLASVDQDARHQPSADRRAESLACLAMVPPGSRGVGRKTNAAFFLDWCRRPLSPLLL